MPPPPAPAPPPAPREDLAVNRAIDRGVGYLRQVLKLKGDQGFIDTEGQFVSAEHVPFRQALIGWTLLECGVPAADRYLKELAAAVRVEPNKLCDTPDLAMAIVFLDRLGLARDRPIIQTCALRLAAGQKPQGLWGAYCLRLLGALPEADEGKFADYLKADADVAPDSRPAAAPHGVEKLPLYLQSCGVVRWQRGLRVPPIQWVRPGTFPGDPYRQQEAEDVGNHQDTQLALLGLWTAQRSGAPVQPSLAFAERYFRRTQRPDGGWRSLELIDPYYERDRKPYEGSDSWSTGAGLLGLGIGEVVARQADKERAARPPAADPDAARGFRCLDKLVKAGIDLDNINEWGDPSACWSLDVVVRAYDLKAIGGKEWRPWAVKRLVDEQEDEGCWSGRQAGYLEATVQTCYALLVLKQVNAAPDLTKDLQKALILDGK
jgi:hypothetical protein